MLFVLPLEQQRRLIVQRRMTPNAVVKDFDEIEDLALSLCPRLVVRVMDQFAFKCVEETLCHTVVPTIDYRTLLV